MATVLSQHAHRFVRIAAEPCAAPTAAALLAHAVDNAANVVPMLVLAANAATSREELAAQTEVVEQLIEDLRHQLFSVLAVHGDLRFLKFSRFPNQE